MDALNELLTSVGEPAATTPESLETRSARFRSAVTDRKLLLVLDNARDAEQVRPLLPASPECLVIVTSRNQLATLVVREGAVPLRLDRMTNEQARDLLTRRVGVLRLGREPLAVDRIIAAATGELALAIVAARLTIDPQLSLAAVGRSSSWPARAVSGQQNPVCPAGRPRRRAMIWRRSSTGPTTSWTGRRRECPDCSVSTRAPRAHFR